MKRIIGAGFAGLIAAHAWPKAEVLEAMPEPEQAHKALLRFRSDAAAHMTGIEFKKVRVRKGIWFRGKFVKPDIRLANMYSAKVLRGEIANRSIWNLDAVDRYIAPENFYQQLLERVGDRIQWNCQADFSGGHTVSTAPLPVAISQLGIDAKAKFGREPINVQRWRINCADVYQTIYYPEAEEPLYRASITGNILIIESMAGESFKDSYVDVDEVFESFGLNLSHMGGGFLQQIDDVEQKYGKISEIDERTRKSLLYELTARHGIYSLGRFATWRNILLDDVVDDIAAIKKMAAMSNYDLRKEIA